MLLIRQRGGALAVPFLQQFHGTANYPPKPVIIAMTRTVQRPYYWLSFIRVSIGNNNLLWWLFVFVKAYPLL